MCTLVSTMKENIVTTSFTNTPCTQSTAFIYFDSIQIIIYYYNDTRLLIRLLLSKFEADELFSHGKLIFKEYEFLLG
jgi:hypothetical protein